MINTFWYTDIFPAWIRHFEQPGTLTTVKHHTLGVPKSSSLQHMVKHHSVTRHKCRAQARKPSDVRDSSCASAPCLRSREHCGVHCGDTCEAPAKPDSRASPVSPGPEPWRRWTWEGVGSGTACSSARFCRQGGLCSGNHCRMVSGSNASQCSGKGRGKN